MQAIHQSVNRLAIVRSDIQELITILAETPVDSQIQSAVEKILEKAKKLSTFTVTDPKDTKKAVESIEKKIQTILSQSEKVKEQQNNAESLGATLQVDLTQQVLNKLSAAIGDIDKLRGRLARGIVNKENEQLRKSIKQHEADPKRAKLVSGIVEYINFGLITAIKQTKQGTLSTVAHIVRNPVTTARAAALYMDIKNALEKEWGKELDKDINKIIQSNFVQGLIADPNIWKAFSLEKQRISTLIALNHEAIDATVCSIIDEPSKVNTDSKLAIIKAIFCGPGIDAIKGLFTDTGITDHGFQYESVRATIIQYIKSSSEIAKRIQNSGINPKLLQEGEVLHKVVTLISKVFNSSSEIGEVLEVVEKVLSKKQELDNQDIDKIFGLVSAMLSDSEVCNELSGLVTDPNFINMLSDICNTPAIKTALSGLGVKADDIAILIPEVSKLIGSLLGRGIEINNELPCIRKMVDGEKLDSQDIAQMLGMLSAIAQDKSAINTLQTLLAHPKVALINSSVLENPYIKASLETFGISTSAVEALLPNITALANNLLDNSTELISIAALLSTKRGNIEIADLAQLLCLSKDAFTSGIGEQLSEIVRSQPLKDTAINILKNHAFIKTQLERYGIHEEILTIAPEVLPPTLEFVANVINVIGTTILPEVVERLPEVLPILEKDSAFQHLTKTEKLVLFGAHAVSALDQANIDELMRGNKEVLGTLLSSALNVALTSPKIARDMQALLGNEYNFAAVQSLAVQAAPISLDILSLAFNKYSVSIVKEKMLGNIAALLSDATPDEQKLPAFFHIIDASIELISQPQGQKLYHEKIQPLLQQHQPFLVQLVNSVMKQSSLGLTVDAHKLVSTLSQPDTLVELKNAYQAFRDSHWISFSGSIMKLLAIKEVRGLVLDAMSELIGLKLTALLPNFMRRLYTGHSMDDAVHCALAELSPCERRNLGKIFEEVRSHIEGAEDNTVGASIIRHALSDRFCKGLNFAKVNFSNTDIDGFNFQGAIFGMNEEGASLSFAGAKITNTNLTNIRLRGSAIDMRNAQLDPKSFISVLPSLIKAQKEGRQVNIEGMNLTSLDMDEKDLKRIQASPFTAILQATEATLTVKESSKSKQQEMQKVSLPKAVADILAGGAKIRASFTDLVEKRGAVSVSQYKGS